MSDREVSEIEEKVQRAEERLASNVLPSEYEELRGQRFELNDAIRWKSVEADRFKDLYGFAEEVLFQFTDFSKVLPTSNLFDGGAFLEDLENGGDRQIIRRQFLTLLATKKILGILKTRVNHELDALQSVSPEEEEKLIGIIESACAEKSRKREKQEVLSLPPPEPKPISDKVPTGEIVVSVKVRGKPPGKDCSHSRIRRTFRKDVQGITHEETSCMLCDTWLGEEEVTPLVAKLSKKKNRKDCKHPTAEWVPGQEGKVARCGEAGCEFILGKAHTYKWREAGLEPFGDDPSKDEVLLFGSVQQEAEA